MQAHIIAIQQLSDNDNPAYFGLPTNVDRSWQRITSHEVITQLKSRFKRTDLWKYSMHNVMDFCCNSFLVLCIFNWELIALNMLLWLNMKTLFIMLVFILPKYIRWFWQQGRCQSTRRFICDAKPVYMLRHFMCESFLETFCIYAVALMRPIEGVNKFNREEWQVQLTPLLNLWKKLNQVCNASSTMCCCPVLKL